MLCSAPSPEFVLGGGGGGGTANTVINYCSASSQDFMFGGGGGQQTLSLTIVLCLPQIGMVAWRMTMLTPQYPEGREIIVIANDITHLIGSFGPEEDKLFQVCAHAILILIM